MNGKIDIDNCWEIIEHFTDPRNEDLHHALVNGINALSIDFKTALREREIVALFEGIHMDLIELYLSGDAATVEKAENVSVKLQSQIIYRFDNLDFESELNAFLNLSKAYLSSADSTSIPRVYFEVNDDYLDNISRLRTIRILWNHLLQSFDISVPRLKIIAVVGKYKFGTEIEEDFIHASIQLMSSLIASADGVLINPPSKSKRSLNFRSRIARNLHHLAMQEGRMGLVHDPLKGSYFIEKESNAYAKAAWNKFVR